MEKRVFSLLLVLMMMAIPVWSEAAVSSMGYSTGLIQHRFDTGAISKPSGHSTWSSMIDIPTLIQYINNDDPNDITSSYHHVYFLNQSGNSYCGGYHESYVGNPFSVSGSAIQNNTLASTTARARIKNRYYNTSQNYSMITEGSFHAN